ncbi:MAG: heterodisulfide reductase-related iron-sulfur binding cluster [Acidimicrobiia bacterium]|nr:MAG: heterodisulfide reductase-related iron-sulfur binding cluster [Acidimicrobiia bacterium]
MSWVTEWAPTKTELDACVDCGLCLPVCPTFQLTGDEAASPRGRLAAMRAVDAGIMAVDERFGEIMDFCLQCRACEVVCPSMVPFGRAMEGAKAEVLAQLPDAGRVLKRGVFGKALSVRGLVTTVSWMAAGAQRSGLAPGAPGPFGRIAGLRPIPIPVPSTRGRSWDPDGTPRGTIALFSGCVMDPWFSEVHVAVIQLLRTAGFRVVAPAEQTCCGALAAHEGAASDAAAMAERNVRAFAGYDTVVVDAAGCSAHLEGQAGDDGTRFVDATELVASLIADGSLPTIDVDRGPVAIQDPCHLRHAQRIVDEPRAILRAGGYQPVEIDVEGMCCGAAGAYQFSHPETSDELGRRKADQVRATGARVVASANPGCEMQLRSHLDATVRVAHPVELYWEAVGESRFTAGN